MNETTITVRVRANAKVPRVEAIAPGEYRVYVDAPAQDGRANERLIALLAKHLGHQRWQLRVAHGARTTIKIIAITPP